MRVLLRGLQRRAAAGLHAAGVFHSGGEQNGDAVLQPLCVFRVEIGEDHHLDRAALVVEDELRHQLSFVRPLLDLRFLDLRHDAADVDDIVNMLMKRIGGGVGEEFQLVGVFVERMAGDVETERFLFEAQLLVVRPLWSHGFRGSCGRRAARREHAEE